MNHIIIDTNTLPAPLQILHEGRQEILVPVFLRITVDPLDGFLEEESVQVALDRLADLPLEVYLGGVFLSVHARVHLHNAGAMARDLAAPEAEPTTKL